MEIKNSYRRNAAKTGARKYPEEAYAKSREVTWPALHTVSYNFRKKNLQIYIIVTATKYQAAWTNFQTISLSLCFI